ncbi:MAG: hypothetical protein HW416_2607 [Chloroflexi bacterium]|nr:hypothetical protein [Chloroflexota bacterium]
MAARLERSFGADSRALIALQDQISRSSRNAAEKTFAIRSYVPTFLIITAHEIHNWADRLEARPLIAVLLRKLIHSTAQDLRKVDFPGHDNAQRHGWDGWIEADAATAWIPSGKSGWEFGTNADPRKKAKDDYEARVAAIPVTAHPTALRALSGRYPDPRCCSFRLSP